MKRTYKCSWCGEEFERLECQTKGKQMLFCCRQCQADYRSKKHNPEGRPITRHPYLSEYNKEHNAERMTDDGRRQEEAERSKAWIRRAERLRQAVRKSRAPCGRRADAWQTSEAGGGRPSQERKQERQQAGEPSRLRKPGGARKVAQRRR